MSPRSFAYALGWSLVFLLVVEAITGAALSAFYSPSTTDAWASVAYIEDRATWGWLVRGIHAHAASVITVIAGMHLFHVAVVGGYRKPKQLTWWLGIGLLGLIVAMAITGFVLRWDQAAFWAHKVEIGIAAGTPVIGGTIRDLALGGNDSGNLTLTRFHMLHVVALPGAIALLTIIHVKQARKHGPTRGPADPLRDVIAMAMAIAATLAIAVTQGVDLGPPADPSSAYDARPLWMVRWLFELRHLAGGAEKIVALLAPAVAGGILVALPILDRDPDRPIKKRLPFIGAVAGLFALIGALTIISIARDAGDDKRTTAMAEVEKTAAKARALAAKYGVPSSGPLDVYATPPMYRARVIYQQKCSGCHDAKSTERVGPIIAPGHGDRAWLGKFLVDPSAIEFWGKTKLGKGDAAMPTQKDIPVMELADVIETVAGDSGLPFDKAKSDRGVETFKKYCSDCHSRSEGVAGASGPGLGGWFSRDYLTHFIGNPGSEVHMGPDSEMPPFAKELTIVERDAVAGYLVWLRTHTQADVDALGAL